MGRDLRPATDYAHFQGETLVASQSNNAIHGDQAEGLIHLPGDLPHASFRSARLCCAARLFDRDAGSAVQLDVDIALAIYRKRASVEHFQRVHEVDLYPKTRRECSSCQLKASKTASEPHVVGHRLVQRLP